MLNNSDFIELSLFDLDFEDVVHDSETLSIKAVMLIVTMRIAVAGNKNSFKETEVDISVRKYRKRKCNHQTKRKMKKSRLPQPEIISAENVVVDDESYCSCRKKDSGEERVACDGIKCKFHRYYFTCAGLPAKRQNKENRYWSQPKPQRIYLTYVAIISLMKSS